MRGTNSKSASVSLRIYRFSSTKISILNFFFKYISGTYKIDLMTWDIEITYLDTNRKERVNIVFVGHVDAGKSTIGGQIMYLTGMVDKRTLEKYEREAKEKGRESW